MDSSVDSYRYPYFQLFDSQVIPYACSRGTVNTGIVVRFFTISLRILSEKKRTNSESGVMVSKSKSLGKLTFASWDLNKCGKGVNGADCGKNASPWVVEELLLVFVTLFLLLVDAGSVGSSIICSSCSSSSLSSNTGLDIREMNTISNSCSSSSSKRTSGTES